VVGSTAGVSSQDTAIGERARMVRRRRGMSVETAAGLAGVDKSFLSRLERGGRAWTRRSPALITSG